MIKDRILIVEDEKNIADLIAAILKANDFDVLFAATAAEACSMTSSYCPDLVMLDLGLPDYDGIQVIQSVRKWSQVPIIVVSARYSEKDKIDSFEQGADDYITKPFGTAELLARIRVALKHSRAAANTGLTDSGQLSIGDLVIDYDKHQVRLNGQNVHLTVNEYKIVALLGKYAGKVITYDSILKQIWGPASLGDNQILRVNMANIRRKIEENPAKPRYIFTVVGVGYRIADS